MKGKHTISDTFGLLLGTGFSSNIKYMSRFLQARELSMYGLKFWVLGMPSIDRNE